MHGPGNAGNLPAAQAPGAGGPSRGELNQSRGYQPERGNRAETPTPRTEPSRRGEPQGAPDRQRTTEQEQRRGADDRARTNREQDRNAERDRAAPEHKDADVHRSAQEHGQDNQRARVGEHREEFQRERTRLSTQDRERLHRTFDFDRARVANAHFSYHVGQRIPREVRLVPLPHEVIGFFPAYRGYSYFVVGDEICVVNPATYEVVDVIEQGYWRGRPQVAELRLSSGQIALVRDSVPRDFPESPLRLRLALGAEIPTDVELYELPEIVTQRVPELREFRFLVAEDQIVIVDPHDNSIAFMIDRS